jgi:nicotinamide-nucleotide amidase
MNPTLLALGETLGERLKGSKQTVAVAESSSGGLISAALLSVSGASAYYLGGGVIYALLLARTVRERFGTTWGISETGAAGPTGNGYGDAAGHTVVAISGPVELAVVVETGSPDRIANMDAFAAAALELLVKATEA